MSGTFSYLDDITVCGKTQEEHDINLEDFLKAASTYNLEINREKKSKFSLRSNNMLSYKICDETLQPNPERLGPLLQMPPPSESKSLCLGMISYYTKWISNYSSKIRPIR